MSHTDGHTPRQPWSVLAFGLCTTIAMWAVAYVALMQPGVLVGEALFGSMLACVFGGGFLAGRATGGGWGTGTRVGLIAAGFNLLMVGSLIGSKSPEGFAAAAGLWVAGTLVGSAVLAGCGAWVGARWAPSHRDAEPANWYGLFTKGVVAAAFLLLISGGIVTGFEAGLAVPDWPGSFGHNMILYPLTQMISEPSVTQGVHYEHAHRLYGMLVGVATLILAITIWLADARKWVGVLAVIALILVSVQGTLGGLRVIEESVPLAIIHGILGQLTFATLASIAAVTSTTWLRRANVLTSPSASTDRTLSILLIALLLLQLTLGTMFRHLNARPDISPDETIGILYTHIVVALLVLAMILFVGIRMMAHYRDQTRVKKSGQAIMNTVGFQIVLGVIAMVAVLKREPTDPIPTWEVVITSLHQATGALLLAFATLYALWLRRLVEGEG